MHKNDIVSLKFETCYHHTLVFLLSSINDPKYNKSLNYYNNHIVIKVLISITYLVTNTIVITIAIMTIVTNKKV